MIKLRCFKCGQAYQLTEQYVANELAAQGISGKPTHYVAECPRCRQANKVSLKRVRLPEAEAYEAEADTGSEDEGPEDEAAGG